jgi:hypothetical protein
VKNSFGLLIEATIIMLVVATLLKNRDRRIRRRFQEIGYLNHHIRNALSAFSPYIRYSRQT